MTKSQRKAENRSFAMIKARSQLGPQRHGQRLDATKKTKASPQEEAKGSTPLAQHRTTEKQLDPQEETTAQHI
jgi:hypothetical protein